MRSLLSASFCALLAVWLLVACSAKHTVLGQLSSPDGCIQASLFLDSYGSPGMDITAYGRQVLSISDIGLATAEGDQLRQGYRMVGQMQEEPFGGIVSLPWGENKELCAEYNLYVITFANRQGDTLLLQVVVSNEGVAFRHLHFCPGSHVVTTESTSYHFPSDGTAWSIPANFESYEFAYRQQPLSATTDANTPITIRLPHGDSATYLSIHEAGLMEGPEMTLVRDSCDSLAFHTWLCPDNSGTGSSFAFDSCYQSPYRTITIGREAVDLMNSQLMLLCNPEEVDFDSPKPIKYIGVWWGMHLGINSWVPDERHGATTANALRYIDFAAKNNIDAVLFEGWNLGWEQWGGKQEFDFIHAAPDFDVERVIAYAKTKGVEIIMHHETGGNIPHYEAQMDSAFQWCEDHGIRYVKTGYAGGFPDQQLHHSHYGVSHYTHAMQCAQRHGIALDVHEPIKPTGLCRSYPNLMSAEGACGMEWNAWSDGNSPAHTTILPFTRLLAGPMDYTPGIFDITYKRIKNDPRCKQWNQKDARQCRVHTTIAKQCALGVVIYSPMVMAADLIENYEGHPMFQFFRDYDPDCDWSRALQGEPGEYVAVVRRAGSKYFLGAITNEDARTLEIPLDFLPPGEEFNITLYADAPDADYRTNPTAYSIIQHQHITSQGVLTLQLAPGGGCAAVISQ